MPILMLLTGAILVAAFVYSPQNVEAGIVGGILLVLGSMGGN